MKFLALTLLKMASRVGVLSFVFFTACQKKDNNAIIFNGIVFDFSTNQRVANTSVTIALTNYSTGDTSYSNPVFTDTDGKYEIEMQIPQGYSGYFVTAKKTGYTEIEYICLSRVIGKLLAAGQTHFSDTTFIDKHTIVTLNINNQPPANPNDTLVVSLSHGNLCIINPTTTIGSYLSIQRQLTGAVNNYLLSDTFSFKEAPLIKANWTLRNGGVINSGIQQISVAEFSNTTHIIDF